MKDVAYDKVITDKEYKQSIISGWVKAKGYDLSVCTISSKTLKLSLNLVYGTFDVFKEFIQKEHGKEIKFDNAEALYLQVDDKDCAWNFILIQSMDWTANDYGVICHELHHFTHYGLEEKGVTYGTGGEEVYAYVQGHFMELVVRAFVELKKVIDNKKNAKHRVKGNSRK
jgi:hypothetical protein